MIKFDPATTFDFKPADYVPFKDRELCEKLRKISGKDLEKHPNPDFNKVPYHIASAFKLFSVCRR